MIKSIIAITGTNKSGINVLSQCLRILGLNSLDDHTQPNISTIHSLLLKDLGLTQTMAGPLPSDWISTPAAERATLRIKSLLKCYQNEADFLFIADPLLSRFMPLWSAAFQESEISTRYLLMLRHPWETSPSLAASENINLAKANLIWLSHTRDSLNALQDQATVLTTFDQLLADPICTLMRIGSELNLSWPIDPYSATTSLLDFVQPGLKHYHASNLPEKDKQKFLPYDRMYQEIRQRQWSKITDNSSREMLTLPGPDSTLTRAKSIPLEKPETKENQDLIDSLLDIIGQYEKQKLNQQAKLKRLNDKTDHSIFAQILFPINHKDGEKVETILLTNDEWQKISLNVPETKLLKEKPIILKPLNTNGSVIISDIQLVHRSTKEVLWSAQNTGDFKQLLLQGTIFRLPVQDNLNLLITGNEPRIILPLIKELADCPADIIFWLKATRNQTLAHKLGTLWDKNRGLILPTEQRAFDNLDKFHQSKEKQFTPLISVIIPCYNSEATLAICLESLFHQTLPTRFYEIICIDDCSSDNTLSLLNDYANRNDNLRVIEQKPNLKQGAARNNGIDSAQGKYITFVDSDDFLRIDALELILDQANDLDILIFQHKLVCYKEKFKFRNSNRKSSNDISKSAANNALGWWPVGLLIKKSILNNNHIRFREGVQFEDIDFVVRLSFCTEKFKVLNEVLYYYIQMENSTVNTISEQKIKDAVIAANKVTEFLISKKTNHLDVWFKSARVWLDVMVKRINMFSLNDKEREDLVDLMWKQIESFSTLKTLQLENFNLSLHKKCIEDYKLNKEKGDNNSEEVKDNFQYLPWGKYYEEKFRDKIIIYCETDSQIQNATPIISELKTRGINCIIIDSSSSNDSKDKQPLTSDKSEKYADIELIKIDPEKSQPCATSAAAYIFMNDLNYTQNFIFELYGFGVPLIGFYDALNNNFNEGLKPLRKPYRSTHYLLVPGFYQSLIYNDRESYIIGLPKIRKLLKEKYSPPITNRAIIEVNFPDGTLEEDRNKYLSTTVQACLELKLQYIIFQHPADKTNLENYTISKTSLNALINNGAIIISSFITTILEALALGRPVVNHIPGQNKIDGFMKPMGVYPISNDIISLKNAIIKELKFIEAGGDIKNRSTSFLHHHANILSHKEPHKTAADAIQNILSRKKPISFKVNQKSNHKISS